MKTKCAYTPRLSDVRETFDRIVLLFNPFSLVIFRHFFSFLVGTVCHFKFRHVDKFTN